MKINLIRHGLTDGNRKKQYIGSTDCPVCQEGMALAEALRGGARPSCVYVTPLRRTQQTAEILFPGVPQMIVAGLREMDFGVFEGRSAADMAGDPAYRSWVEGGCRGVCPGGESMDSFAARVCGAFTQLLVSAGADRQKVSSFAKTDLSPDPDSMTFVLHGGVIMALLSTFAEPKKDFYEYFIDNCRGFSCDCSFTGGVPVLTDLHPISGSQW